MENMEAAEMQDTNKVTKFSVFKVPVDNITPLEGFNVRNDYGDIETLANSIEAKGVLMAVRGWVDRKDGVEVYRLTDGHRRYTAAKLVQERTGVKVKIPFMVEPKGYSDVDRILDMLTTDERKMLDSVEKAEAVNRLKAYGMTQEQIATKLGKSQVEVSNMIKLSMALPVIKNAVQENVISTSTALNLINSKKDVAETNEVIKKAKEVKETTGKKVTAKEMGVSKTKLDKLYDKLKKDLGDELDKDTHGMLGLLCDYQNGEIEYIVMKSEFRKKGAK